LLILSIACIAIATERLIFLALTNTPRQALGQAIEAFFANGDVSAFQSKLGKLKGTEARVILAGLERVDAGSESVEKAMIGTATAERMKMERGLFVLATVGSNAPFIGLFGTVLGIIQAFNDLAKSQHEASEAVMAGISEALVATAVGLLVAIPAVVLYNAFNRWVKTRLGRTDSLADMVLAKLPERS